MHQAQVPLLEHIAASLTPADVVELMDLLQTLEQAPTQNLNLQLCLENFLFRFHQTMHRDAA